MCRPGDGEGKLESMAEREGGASRVFVALGVALVVLVAAGAGYRAYARSKRAAVGAECTAEWGCVEGARCVGRADVLGMSGGDKGRCFATCVTDAACGAGRSCQEGICRRAVALGAPCAFDDACQGGDCVSIEGASPTCRSSCVALCEVPGFVCRQVMLGPAASPHQGGYCVPGSQ